jgi:hypothetical protein
MDAAVGIATAVVPPPAASAVPARSRSATGTHLGRRQQQRGDGVSHRRYLRPPLRLSAPSCRPVQRRRAGVTVQGVCHRRRRLSAASVRRSEAAPRRPALQTRRQAPWSTASATVAQRLGRRPLPAASRSHPNRGTAGVAETGTNRSFPGQGRHARKGCSDVLMMP